MAGTSWTSATCLTRFNQLAGRPTTDAIADAQKYVFLSDGQEAVLTELSTIVPNLLYPAPILMTSSDGGYTYTFGTDGNGYALFPMGRAQIYPSLNAVPDYPWRPGVDYLDEGTTIRMPNNVPYAGPLYWRGMTQPAQMTAVVEPVIQPPSSRTLLVTKAVQLFAEQFLRNAALADQMQIRWERDWPKHCTMMRKHFSGARPTGSVTAGSGYGGGGPGAGMVGGYVGTGW
jgi:hypothetical protein